MTCTSCYIFAYRNGSFAYPDCAIYEVGGNIGRWKDEPFLSDWSDMLWHLHVFLLIELMRLARSYAMNCASTRETLAVHLQLSEQTNSYHTHVLYVFSRKGAGPTWHSKQYIPVCVCVCWRNVFYVKLGSWVQVSENKCFMKKHIWTLNTWVELNVVLSDQVVVWYYHLD